MAARLRWSKASEMFAKGRRRTIRFLEPIRTLTTRTGSSHSATRITSTFSTDSGQEDESAEDRTAHKRPRRNRTKERELRAKRRSEMKERLGALRILDSKLGSILRQSRRNKAVNVIKVALQEWFTEGPHFRVVRFACRRVRKCSLLIQRAWKFFKTVMKARERVILRLVETVEGEYHHLLWRLQENLAAERFQRRIERETNTPWIRDHRLCWNNTQRRVNSFLFEHHATFAPNKSPANMKGGGDHQAQRQRPNSRNRRSSVSSRAMARRKTLGAVAFEDLNHNALLLTINNSGSESSLAPQNAAADATAVLVSSLNLSDDHRFGIAKSIMQKKWQAHKKSQWAKRGVLDALGQLG